MCNLSRRLAQSLATKVHNYRICNMMSTGLVFLLICLMKGVYPVSVAVSTGKIWSNWSYKLAFPVLCFLFDHTGGELFALLEREGVFLEDAARYELL